MSSPGTPMTAASLRRFVDFIPIARTTPACPCPLRDRPVPPNPLAPTCLGQTDVRAHGRRPAIGPPALTSDLAVSVAGTSSLSPQGGLPRVRGAGGFRPSWPATGGEDATIGRLLALVSAVHGISVTSAPGRPGHHGARARAPPGHSISQPPSRRSSRSRGKNLLGAGEVMFRRQGWSPVLSTKWVEVGDSPASPPRQSLCE